ncbi:MAG: hypothetical protein LIP11_19815 [Clostridiales bacterium]|nr:hypothetical protein [Clostridiales bacterium]
MKYMIIGAGGTGGILGYCTVGAVQREGKQREMFKAMICEIIALAEAMGIHFGQNLVAVNLKILSDLAPEATTSMQRDIMTGKASEIDGLIYEVVRLGKEYEVPMPQYEKAAAQFEDKRY